VVAARAADLDREDPLVCLDVYLIKATHGLVDDLLHIPAGRVREVVSVHDDHGPKGAGPQTVHGFQGDLLVWSRFSRFDAKLPFEFVGNARASADMTGCSQANGDEMFPARVQAERPIESGDTVNVDQGAPCFLSHNSKGFLGQITEPCLNLFEDGDESTAIILMAFNNLVNVIRIHEEQPFGVDNDITTKTGDSLSILFAVPDPALEFRKSACLAFFACAAEAPGFERLEPSRSRFIHHTSWRNWRNVPDEGSSFGRWGKDAVELFALQHRMVRSFGIGTSRSFLAARTEALIHTLLKG